MTKRHSETSAIKILKKAHVVPPVINAELNLAQGGAWLTACLRLRRWHPLGCAVRACIIANGEIYTDHLLINTRSGGV
jgi:hypothetical protein